MAARASEGEQMGQVEGKAAIVTSGGSGIGTARAETRAETRVLEGTGWALQAEN
jgi:hypothetical protein